MNMIELCRALRQLRLSGMAAVLETRILQAQTEKHPPIDFISMLVQDELIKRQDRLLERRVKDAAFRDHGRTLDTFDFDFVREHLRRCGAHGFEAGWLMVGGSDAITGGGGQDPAP